MQSQLKGTLLVALSGVLFGLMGFLGTKLFYLQLTVENMLFWRFLVATIWIFPGMLLFKNNVCKHAIRPSTLIMIFILGGLSYSGGSVFYFLASKHIGTGLAMAIFFSFPVFVTLFAWVLGTWKMNKFAFAALAAVMTGLILLKGRGDNALDFVGIMLAVIAAICFATYVYGSQHTTKNLDSRLLALLVCIGNTLIFLGVSCYTKSFAIPYSLTAWLYICAIGVIATALPIQLLLDGLKYISPVKASILSAFEPIVTVLVGWTFLGESLTLIQTMGVLIVLFGAILIQFERAPP
jgi:drug/metabolite transporter (DMT)-like permease